MSQPHDDDAEPVILDHDDQDGVTATRPLPEADPGDLSRLSPEQMPTIGHVGRYALKYCIGEGGLGTVYAAHDPLLSRLIAIKTMQVNLPEQDRPQFNALFLNEAKAAGSLSHPHIVTVYDAGAGQQGTYIAMELLRGKDLRQLLAVGWRPTPSQAALIVRRVADALSYAHHKGVIHRDIKPANIFMVGRTQPRVLDFGIARIRQVESQASDGLSRFGELVGGSPHYMAPEQVRHEPVDRRADVYALGVVLYELLTGRKPFTGQDLDEITRAVLGDTPPAPHELNPDVPPALSDIALRAMARDLVQRTRSARTLSQELRDWLDSQTDAAPLAAEGKAGRSSSSRSARSARAAAAPAPRSASAADAPTQTHRRGPGAAVWLGGLAVAMAAVGAGVGWWWTQGADATAPAAAAPSSPVPPTAARSAPVPVAVTPAPVPVPVDAAAPSASAVSGPAASASDPFAALQSPAGTPSAVPPVAPAAATPAPVAPPVAAKPVPTGTVRLAISPWGRVFVGKRALGVTPPLTQFTLPQGRHTITIRNDDFPPYTETVEVRPGQPVTVSHAF